jgi:hypothetical protein
MDSKGPATGDATVDLHHRLLSLRPASALRARGALYSVVLSTHTIAHDATTQVLRLMGLSSAAWCQ